MVREGGVETSCDGAATSTLAGRPRSDPQDFGNRRALTGDHTIQVWPGPHHPEWS